LPPSYTPYTDYTLQRYKYALLIYTATLALHSKYVHTYTPNSSIN